MHRPLRQAEVENKEGKQTNRPTNRDAPPIETSSSGKQRAKGRTLDILFAQIYFPEAAFILRISPFFPFALSLLRDVQIPDVFYRTLSPPVPSRAAALLT